MFTKFFVVRKYGVSMAKTKHINKKLTTRLAIVKSLLRIRVCRLVGDDVVLDTTGDVG